MKQPPNIVLIVLDTHRYDRLGMYGYQRGTSPNLDDFARQSTAFTNGVSPAQWTVPAHASMFTGEYPSTHQTVQAHLSLDQRFDTIAKLLTLKGYKTTGFCNNPLVGVLDNNLKHGFETFYNYGGAVPSVPRGSSKLPQPLNTLWEWYTQQLRAISYPIQNAAAHSDFIFQLSMNPLLVPIWSKLANFKGDTARSLRDSLAYLRQHATEAAEAPHFTFINLMEPHLPYSPPEDFVNRFAPYFKEEREVRDFMRKYNSQAFRWLLPVEERFKAMESQILNDMYDAEVAYQDYLLAELLEYLNSDQISENTMTIIVGDHGEGLGEHDFMGHSFVAYQELVHVPLIIKFPKQAGVGQTVDDTVSTRRIFHTILDAAHTQVYESDFRPATDVQSLSLARSLNGKDPEQGIVFAEAYAPNTFLSMMETHVPQLIDTYHCRLNRRAVYQDNRKLVRIDGLNNDELFHLNNDPLETNNVIAEHRESAGKLGSKLDAFMMQAVARQPDTWHANRTLDLDGNEKLLNQLRALGYIE